MDSSLKYVDMDRTAAFAQLAKCRPFDVRTGLNPSRIESCTIDEAGSLSFNYASLPVDEDILDALQSLADEQQLVEKYKALLSGEVMNVGEHRLVLHQLTRGRVLEGVPVMADGVAQRAARRSAHPDNIVV